MWYWHAGLVMGKVEVNGKDQSPVYTFLQVKSGDTSPISWNFGKHLVRAGKTMQPAAWWSVDCLAAAWTEAWACPCRCLALGNRCQGESAGSPMDVCCRADLTAAHSRMLAADTHPASSLRI